LPVATTCAISFCTGRRGAIDRVTNRSSSILVRATNFLADDPPIAAASNGSSTNMTVTRPPNRCAVATACSSALRECDEKSMGHRIDLNVIISATSFHGDFPNTWGIFPRSVEPDRALPRNYLTRRDFIETKAGSYVARQAADGANTCYLKSTKRPPTCPRQWLS
jgi:hypothetical protein